MGRHRNLSILRGGIQRGRNVRHTAPFHVAQLGAVADVVSAAGATAAARRDIPRRLAAHKDVAAAAPDLVGGAEGERWLPRLAGPGLAAAHEGAVGCAVQQI